MMFELATPSSRGTRRFAHASWAVCLGSVISLLTVSCSSSDAAGNAGAGGSLADAAGGGAPVGAGGTNVSGASDGGAAVGSGGAPAAFGGSGGAPAAFGGSSGSSGDVSIGGAPAGGGPSGGAGASSGGSGGTGGLSGGAISCSAGMVPIRAKGKSYTIGLEADDAPMQSNGKPWACYLGKHQVSFTYDYCADANLVTQGDFSALMGFNPSKHQTGDLKLPVDSETWYDAVLYCNKKSVKDGLTPAYSYGAVTLNGKSASNIADVTVDIKKNGYRLPTNAEYEYAERADTVGLYFFSPTKTDNITQLGAAYAWYTTNSKGVSQPVGLLKANPWGLYDIVGNLFEWEHDWDRQYPATPESDSSGLDKGNGCDGSSSNQKMAKGGSWHTDVASHMRIGYHYRWAPSSVSAELGFRSVATLK